jgi:hypothetical protein
MAFFYWEKSFIVRDFGFTIKEFKNIPLHENHGQSNGLDKEKEVVVSVRAG